jgi:hypothetical protein
MKNLILSAFFCFAGACGGHPGQLDKPPVAPQAPSPSPADKSTPAKSVLVKAMKNKPQAVYIAKDTDECVDMIVLYEAAAPYMMIRRKADCDTMKGWYSVSFQCSEVSCIGRRAGETNSYFEIVPIGDGIILTEYSYVTGKKSALFHYNYFLN